MAAKKRSAYKKKTTTKKIAKKTTKQSTKKTAKKKTNVVTIRLTKAQRDYLKKKTKGQFTDATFVFPKGKRFRAPSASARCRLARVNPLAGKIKKVTTKR